MERTSLRIRIRQAAHRDSPRGTGRRDLRLVLVAAIVALFLGSAPATTLAGQTTEVVPKDGEEFLPWTVVRATDHVFLQFEEREKGGLLADARKASDFSEDTFAFARHESRSFWEKNRFLQRHDRKFSLRKKKAKPRGVHYFFITVYYTPYQEAFRKELGYDTTPTAKSRLKGKFSKSFLRASMMEGFGKLEKPVKGNAYIKFDGKWGYANRILGNRNNTLLPRRSAAMHRKHPFFKKRTRLRILDPQLHNVFGSIEWQVDDTGFGLHISQLDLYWGEDYPLGPGRNTARPAGTRFQKSWIVPVLVEQ